MIYFLIKIKNTINIMSFNVCEQAINLTNRDNIYGESLCKTKKGNICRNNIIKFINNSDFDFLGIQEGDSKLFKKLKYEFITGEQGKSIACIVYNHQKFKIIYQIDGKTILKPRKWVAGLFNLIGTSINILVISLHMPHFKYFSLIKKELEEILKQCKIWEEYNPKIIIVGDFNFEINNNITIKKKTFYNSFNNNFLNTGYDKSLKGLDKYLTKSSDHILYDSTKFKKISKVETKKTLNNKILPNNFPGKMSDHLAIATKLQII
jgi:hypothetical protein